MNSSGQPHIVVDANLVVSAEITTSGNPAMVLDAWRAGRCAVVVSEDLMTEMEAVFSRPRLRQR